MAKKKALPKLAPSSTGRYAFLLGFAIAIVAGLVGAAAGLGNYAGWISLILVILGIIVGFLNISKAERQAFLVAAIALSLLGLVSFKALAIGGYDIGAYLTSVLSYIVMFVAPAAAVTALYEIRDLARG